MIKSTQNLPNVLNLTTQPKNNLLGCADDPLESLLKKENVGIAIAFNQVIATKLMFLRLESKPKTVSLQTIDQYCFSLLYNPGVLKYSPCAS